MLFPFRSLRVLSRMRLASRWIHQTCIINRIITLSKALRQQLQVSMAEDLTSYLSMVASEDFNIELTDQSKTGQRSPYWARADGGTFHVLRGSIVWKGSSLASSSINFCASSNKSISEPFADIGVL